MGVRMCATCACTCRCAHASCVCVCVCARAPVQCAAQAGRCIVLPTLAGTC